MCTIHAYLRRMHHRSALVIPANEGPQYLPDMPTFFPPEHSGTLAGAQFRLSISAKRGASTSQPARLPLASGHSCNCHAVRLSRLAAGIMPSWSFGRKRRTAHSLTNGGSSRLVFIAPRLLSFPAEPKARSHRSDAGSLLVPANCGYRATFRP